MSNKYCGKLVAFNQRGHGSVASVVLLLQDKTHSVLLLSGDLAQISMLTNKLTLDEYLIVEGEFVAKWSVDNEQLKLLLGEEQSRNIDEQGIPSFSFENFSINGDDRNLLEFTASDRQIDITQVV
jgi:hypothetical protein